MSLLLRQFPVLVHIVLSEDLCDDFVDASSFLGNKIPVLLKISISIKDHLNVLVEALIANFLLVTQIFSIDSDKLRKIVLLLSVPWSTQELKFDLLASHVRVLPFVSLSTAMFFGVTQHSCDTHKVVNGWVTDPGHVT